MDPGADASTPAADPTRWTKTGALAEARSSHTATRLLDGRVLVVGGEDADGRMLASSEIFDPAAGAWSRGPAMPGPRSNHTATLLDDGRVLVVGGGLANSVGAPSGESVRADALVFDPTSGAFTKTASPSVARAFHLAERLRDGRVLVAGGGANRSIDVPLAGAGGRTEKLAVALADAELFDPKAGTWAAAPSLAKARYLAAGVALDDGRVLVVGGVDETQTSFATTEIFDPAAGAWQAGPLLSTGDRLRHAIAKLPDGRVVVAAGKKSNVAFLTTAEIFDPAAGAWKALPKLGVGRTSPALAVLPSGRLLLSGGYACSATGCGALEDSSVYEPGGSTWKAFAAQANPRAVHTATTLADGRVLVAGGLQQGGVTETCELAVP